MKISPIIIFSLCLFLLSACQKTDQIHWLSQIDSILEENPDSAAGILVQLSHVQSCFSQEEEALYNLLQTKIDIILKKEIASDSVINSVIDYYEKSNNSHRLAYAYFYKGKINFSNSADSLAILYTLKAIDKANIVHNLPLIIEIHNQLGLIYLFQNLPQNSLEEFKKAYSFVEGIPNKSYYKPLLMRNMARAHSLRSYLQPDGTQYTDSAILYYNNAFSLMTDSTPRSLPISIYRELVTIYLFKNEFSKVFEYLDASIDSTDLILHYNKKADIFMRTGQLDSAVFYAGKCMDDSRLYLRYSVYDKLYQIERDRKNIGKAIEYVDTLFKLGDSLIACTVPDKIIEIQKKYNEEKLRTEKANLEVKYEKEKNHSLRISFIVVLLLILGTYIYIYNDFKKKRLQQSLLKQKNELLLLNQKIQQWNQQVELNHKKIKQLEQDKERIKSDLHIISKEKETILKQKDEELQHYQRQESDMSIQKAKYEELCFVEFKKLFLLMPLSRKIPAFGTDKIITDSLNSQSQKQLMDIMDEIYYNFASRLYVLLQESVEKTCLCCLIKLQVKPKYIMVLCNLSKEAYYKQCQRIVENLIGKSSVSALKDYLNTF